jgi:signal transduction histidine kinase
VRGSLDLWLLDHFEEVISPIRNRLLQQLGFLALVQLTTWLAFSLFVRHTFLGFREMETRIIEEEKMAKLGMAASLIAHEVKNTLNGITAATSYDLSNDAGQQLSGRVVRSQLARLSNLAKSLLFLGRPLRPNLAPVQLEQVVREAIDGLRILPESTDVKLNVELDEALTIQADPALVATAVDNVIRNAIEAAVAAKDMGKTLEPRVRVDTLRRDGIAALIVEDNGGGPPPDFEEHAFEPFVTSKPKGVGLGLTTTRQSMEALGGSVAFERTESGSRFVLNFRLHSPTGDRP